MIKGDEVFGVVIIDVGNLNQSAKEGVEWLDSVHHMLQK